MEIVRIESSLDRNGNPRTFCHVIFDDATYGRITFAHWLTPVERQTYEADNTSITTIMEKYRINARVAKMEELASIGINLEEEPN